MGHVLFQAIALVDEGPLQDDFALLVSLVLVGGVLVDPAQLSLAGLARHITHNVTASQHHTVLSLTVIEVDNFVEQEGPASGPSEPGGDELAPVGQERLAVDAAEQAEPAQVGQVVAAHDVSGQSGLG